MRKWYQKNDEPQSPTAHLDGRLARDEGVVRRRDALAALDVLQLLIAAAHEVRVAELPPVGVHFLEALHAIQRL